MTTTHDDELRETLNKIAAAIWTADKRPEFEVLNDIRQVIEDRDAKRVHLNSDNSKEIGGILAEYNLGPKLFQIYDEESLKTIMNEPRAKKAAAAFNELLDRERSRVIALFVGDIPTDGFNELLKVAKPVADLYSILEKLPKDKRKRRRMADEHYASLKSQQQENEG